MRLPSSSLASCLSVVLAGALGACSSDPPPPPPPPPTQLLVTVVDSASGQALEGARVQLVERGEVLTTDASGQVLKELDPLADPGVYTYRVQAAGHVGVPRPGRPPKYVTLVKEQRVELTVVLEPRPGAPVEGGTLSGKVTSAGAPVQGVLVIAGATGYFSAVTDKDGAYVMLGVAPDFYTVTAFAPGYASSTKNSVEMRAGLVKDGVDLALTAQAGGTISGNLVGGTGTSSIALVHPGSGEAVPGLSTKAQLGGRFSIHDVPPGIFRVVGGLELDGTTYDAQWLHDEGLPELTMTGTSSLTADLKFAPAIRGLVPATGTSSVAVQPDLTWPSVPMANFYVVEVRNVAGQVVYGGFDTRGSPRVTILAPATTARPDMPLARGSLYNWRVYAAKDVTTGQQFELLGASEELDGEIRTVR